MFISLTFGNLWWWWKNRWIVREMRATGRCREDKEVKDKVLHQYSEGGTMQPVSCQHQWDGDFQLWAVNFRRNSWHSRLSIMDNHTYIIYIYIYVLYIYIYMIYIIYIYYIYTIYHIYILYNYTFSYSWFRWIVHVFGMPPVGCEVFFGSPHWGRDFWLPRCRTCDVSLYVISRWYPLVN